jgi:hypothetical protein
MTPSLSSLTPPNKARLLKQLEEMAAAVKALPTITPCALCDWFEANNCKQWKQAVPAEAQAAGCSEWMEKLPF